MFVFKAEVARRKRVTFVAGLSWQPLVPDSFKKSLGPLAQELRADLYVYRRSDKAMVGLASSQSGAAVGQVPLALVISEKLLSDGQASNAMVAVELPESGGQVAYIMIRDGYVLAGYDRVGNAEQIREAFFADLSSADDWDALICPASWKVGASSERDIAWFLPTKGGTVRIPDFCRLRPVKPPRVKKLLLIGLAAGAVLLADHGYLTWKNYRAQEAARKFAAESAAAAEMLRQQKVSALPWLGIPTALEYANACQRSLDSVDVFVPGWDFTGYVCDGGSLMVSWTRSGKNGLLAAMRNTHPGATIAADGNQASLVGQVPMKQPDPAGQREEPPAVEARIIQMRDYQVVYGVNMVVVADNKSARVVDGVVLPWTDFRFTVDSQLSPESVIQAIDAPGLRINRIAATYSGGLFKYQLQGVQYAKP
jgi:hypothetical protein